MSEHGPQPDPDNIDELLASIEATTGDVDVLADFADDFSRKGMHGMSLDSPEGLAHFKDMYGQMWERLAALVLAGDAQWRKETSPQNQLESLFGALWDLNTMPDQKHIASLTFGLAYNDDKRDGDWGVIFGDTSYYGKNELQRVIESICRDGHLGREKDPDRTAILLLNYLYTTYVLSMVNGEILSRDEFLEGVDSYLQ